MLAQNDPEGAPEESKEPKEPPKAMSKLVRVMTVLAYLSSVSMAAILLSIYYLCIWKSPVLSDLEVKVSHQQGESFDYQRGYINNDSVLYNGTGGSSTSVNDSDNHLPPSNVAFSDDHGLSEVIETTVTESTTPFNSSVDHNETTEPAIASVNETTIISRSTSTI